MAVTVGGCEMKCLEERRESVSSFDFFHKAIVRSVSQSSDEEKLTLVHGRGLLCTGHYSQG